MLNIHMKLAYSGLGLIMGILFNGCFFIGVAEINIKHMVDDDTELFRSLSRSEDFIKNEIVDLQSIFKTNVVLIKLTRRGKEYQINTTALLFKLHAAPDSHWHPLSGKYFLICPALKIPPKAFGSKIEIILPFLPNIVVFSRNTANVFRFQLLGSSNFINDFGFKLILTQDNSKEFAKHLTAATAEASNFKLISKIVKGKVRQ